MDDAKKLARPASSNPVTKPRAEPPILPTLDAAFEAALLPLRRSVHRVEQFLQRRELERNSDSQTTPDIDLESVRVSIEKSLEPLCGQINQLVEQVATFIQQSQVEDEVLLEDDSLAVQPWEEIILGQDLCADESISEIRALLISDVVSGSLAARAFAGQLLLLQAAGTNEFPEHLQDVGEAYYGWRPRTSIDEDPFERALADCLTRRAESAGLPNSIQLVRPGSRFDDMRHTTETRGSEIVGVHGWIVLRENQKVYTKASVTLR